MTDIETIRRYIDDYRRYTEARRQLSLCEGCIAKIDFDKLHPFVYDKQVDMYIYPDYGNLICPYDKEACKKPQLLGTSKPNNDEVISALIELEKVLLALPKRDRAVDVDFDSDVDDEVREYMNRVKNLINKKCESVRNRTFDVMIFKNDVGIARDLFYMLKRGNILSRGVRMAVWLYVCGFSEQKAVTKANFKPIDYKGTKAGFSHFIYTFFEKQGDLWSVAASCFTVNGEKLNNRLLAKAYSSSTLSSFEINRIDGIKKEFDKLLNKRLIW